MSSAINPTHVVLSNMYYGRIHDFFRRIGQPHPGFEEIQVPAAPGFVATRYDNGIRWMSRLGKTEDGDWTMYSTQTSLACQGEEYRTREQARLAFVVSFGKDVVALGSEAAAREWFAIRHKILRYSLPANNPRYLKNLTLPDRTRIFGDLEVAVRKIELLDMQFLIVGRTFGRALAINLHKKLLSIATNLAMGFALGLANAIRKVLTTQNSVNKPANMLNPYPYYDYGVVFQDEMLLKEAADAAYACVIANNDDHSYRTIKGRAGVLGAEIGKAMAEVEYEVAEKFRITMKKELMALIKDRKSEDGLGDLYMGGMF